MTPAVPRPIVLSIAALAFAFILFALRSDETLSSGSGSTKSSQVSSPDSSLMLRTGSHIDSEKETKKDPLSVVTQSYSKDSIHAMLPSMSYNQVRVLVFDGNLFRVYSSSGGLRQPTVAPLLVRALKDAAPERFQKGQAVFFSCSCSSCSCFSASCVLR